MAALACLLALAVSACTGGSSAGSGGTTTSSLSTLVMPTDLTLITPGSLDPDTQAYQSGTGFRVESLLYENLYALGNSSNGNVTPPQPQLASSYTLSPDGKTWTFHLNPAAKFSDGTPVTSTDVLWSWNRLKNMKGGRSSLVANWTITAPNAETVVIQTPTPDLSVLGTITWPYMSILNANLLEKHGGTDASDAATADKASLYMDSTSAGSGPYVIQSFSTQKIVLAANANYWGPDKPQFKEVIFDNSQPQQGVLSVETGEAQLEVEATASLASSVNTSEVNVKTVPSFTFAQLFMNTKASVSQWTANTDFQNAVRYGIDYQDLVRTFGPGASLLPGVISLVPGSLPISDAIQQNVGLAKSYLAKSGYNGQPVPIDFTQSTAGGISLQSIATKLQSYMKAIGINIVLNPLSTSALNAAFFGGTMPMALFGTSMIGTDPSWLLSSCPGGAIVAPSINWQPSNAPANIVDACNAAANTSSQSMRLGLYQQAEKAMQGAPTMPLFVAPQVYVYSKQLCDVYNLPAVSVNLRQLKPC